MPKPGDPGWEFDKRPAEKPAEKEEVVLITRIATRELGWRNLAKQGEERLTVGVTHSVTIAITTSIDDEERIPVSVTGDNIISWVGPETAGSNEMTFRIEIAPETPNPVNIVINYADGAPATTITLPVVAPLVSYLDTTEVEVGRRLITIHGSFLEGCAVELQPVNDNVGRIVRQKNFGDRIEVEITSEEEGNCSLRLAYGQSEPRHFLIETTDHQPLVVELIKTIQRQPNYWLWAIGATALLLLLSYVFFG